MPVAPKPTPDTVDPTPLVDAPKVREQLGRLLAHPLFANSKRYPALLAYTVEQSLLGNAGELKERSIAVEVFGRAPTYDANADPVVRITAGEVRKRLTQYYYDPAHREELIIELPTGSYVPVFRGPERAPQDSGPTTESTNSLPVEETLQPPADPPVPIWRRWWIAPLVLVLVTGAAVSGWIAGRRYHDDPPPPSNIDRFWEPVTASLNPTTFCLGEPAKNIDLNAVNSYDAPVVTNSQPEQLYVRLHFSGHLALADVITLTRTVAALASRHKSFRVVPASEASFAQLREGPVVLIGAFDNIWTLRVTQKLRFGFESKEGEALLVDRKSQKQTWATAWDLPYQKLSRDYAIVARIHDATTGQPVIIAAGISEEGTEAAGEILYNPVYLDSLLAKAPKNWDQMNMEAVIGTQVIEGHPGPPTILAVETW